MRTETLHPFSTQGTNLHVLLVAQGKVLIGEGVLLCMTLTPEQVQILKLKNCSDRGSHPM